LKLSFINAEIEKPPPRHYLRKDEGNALKKSGEKTLLGGLGRGGARKKANEIQSYWFRTFDALTEACTPPSVTDTHVWLGGQAGAC
jgi:hypothetical protein